MIDDDEETVADERDPADEREAHPRETGRRMMKGGRHVVPLVMIMIGKRGATQSRGRGRRGR